MIRSLAITSIVVASILTVACGGSDVTVGKTGASNEKLQTKQDGSATGDGKVCSWEGTSVYASLYGNAPVPVPTYVLGDDFKSIDGCNECQCGAQGILCTVNVCADAGPVACPALARVCADGSTAVAGPNCSLLCPGDPVACPADAKKCPDGSYVSRTAPNCDFAACDGGGSACPALVKKCADGSFVGPTGPNCTFPDCPVPTGSSCNDLQTSAKAAIVAALTKDGACTADTDCVAAPDATSCSAGCSAVVSKAGQSDYDGARAQVEADQCAKFKAASCVLAATACPAIATIPKCVNNKCAGGVDP